MAQLPKRLKRLFADFRRSNLSADTRAAVVLGVESVPDGLASGLLAGVNPVAGLYAYMFGVASGALFTSTAFMAIQGTGAMAIIVADADINSADDPTRSLVTLSMLTGLVMVAAGYLRLGSVLRFVPNSVMTGFIGAVGINIVLGQFGDFSGYDAEGSNRIVRAIDTIFHPGRLDPWTLMVGGLTIGLIVWLRKTRLGPMGLVVAIIGGSVLAALLRRFDRAVELVGNVADVPDRLPLPSLPMLSQLPVLIIPAVSLAFVGIVQGAGVSAAFVGESKGDESEDFVAQGAGNIVAGAFQGMPVGGSMSATSLITAAGAKSRWALVFTGGVMAVVILVFGGVVEYIAMPALAGLLIVVGLETVKPDALAVVYKTGPVQATVMSVTFGLTLLIPLQYAVLVGVGIAMILFVIRQSNQLETRRIEIGENGELIETEPPAEVPAGEVVILQPYGSLFFAAAPTFESDLPSVTDHSVGSVVILRFRGKPDVGSTLLDVLDRYSKSLDAVDSKLMIVTDSDRIIEQLVQGGVVKNIGESDLYRSTPVLTATVVRAAADAGRWMAGPRQDREQGDLDDEHPS